MNVKKNGLEWTVFALSAAVIAAALTVLFMDAMKPGNPVPDLRVSTGTATPANGSFRVPVHVRNDGEETAEEAVVQVVLESADGELERAEITFPFVPRRSTREGWVVFRQDPACCRVTARPVAFRRP